MPGADPPDACANKGSCLRPVVLPKLTDHRCCNGFESVVPRSTPESRCGAQPAESHGPEASRQARGRGVTTNEMRPCPAVWEDSLLHHLSGAVQARYQESELAVCAGCPEIREFQRESAGQNQCSVFFCRNQGTKWATDKPPKHYRDPADRLQNPGFCSLFLFSVVGFLFSVVFLFSFVFVYFLLFSVTPVCFLSAAVYFRHPP